MKYYTRDAAKLDPVGRRCTVQELGSLKYKGLTVNEWLGSLENFEAILKQFDAETQDGLVAMGVAKAKDIVSEMATGALTAATVTLVKTLIPGGGFLNLFNGFLAFVRHFKAVVAFFAKLGEILVKAASYSVDQVKDQTIRVFEGAIVLGLNLLFSAFGLDRVVNKIRSLIDGWKQWFRNLFQKFLAWFKKKCIPCEEAAKKNAMRPRTRKPASPRRGKTGQCFPSRMRSDNGQQGQEEMSKRRLGQRVRSYRVGEPGYAASEANRFSTIDPSLHRAIWFRQEQQDGRWVKFGLLRSLLWMESNEIRHEGDRMEMLLAEMGVVGEAQIMRREKGTGTFFIADVCIRFERKRCLSPFSIDLVNEGKAITWTEGVESAVVSLENGAGKARRIVVTGGRDGIEFIERDGKLFMQIEGQEVQVKTVIGHTHPVATGPSQGDLDALDRLGQTRSYIVEIGGAEPGAQIIRPK